MIQTSVIQKISTLSKRLANHRLFIRVFLYGLVLPLSFAPFHYPGLAYIALALFYLELKATQSNRHAFLSGLFFGLGYFGLGTSWIFVSIYEYGHLNYVVAALITLLFLLYLSLFLAVMAFIFKKLIRVNKSIYTGLLFSALWVLFEYFRSSLFSGFPWLLLGYGQFDTPAKQLLPIIGVLGLSFWTCFASTLLTQCSHERGKKRYFLLITFVSLILAPSLLTFKHWAKVSSQSVSVGVIQANLSMRDKWDENLFWQLLAHYKENTESLLGTQLIVMPESAIPLPPSYIEEFLATIHAQARRAGSAIMLGIPQPTTVDETSFFNALIGLGHAKGAYLKQHLVPFGEYIPKPFLQISKWLMIPDTNLKPGNKNQTLLKVRQHTIATLICYELAYGDLLRNQLPNAEWIVSISDDGWFGHSLAMYQQLQMAQVRSIETARYQVVANNDGLSSLINTKGDIVAMLPAFSAGILKADLYPASGITPWVYWGDAPILIICVLILLCFLILNIRKQTSLKM